MRWIIFAAVLWTVVAHPLYSQEKTLDSMAIEFVDQLAGGEFSAATKRFDPTMSSAMPADKLEQTWNALQQQVGAFKQRIGTRQDKVQQYDVVFVTCAFENANIDIRVVFDSNAQIAGLFFQPAQAAVESKPPDYANPDSYSETEVVVQADEFSLPGTLTLPKSTPAPAVVLVHGSGPSDRDETVGPNKPFRDLAVGLASQGIAVLRYEKRTKQYAEEMAEYQDITVQEETISDAVAAVALLKDRSEINSDQIYLLGHSLGGTLVPRIAQQDEQSAGFIIMAGAARPLEDLILDQFRYIYNLDNQLTEDEKQHLERLEKQIQTVKSDELSKATPAEALPLGVPASYWLDLKDYEPVKLAKKIQRPLLILHGQRDYQVTMEDYQMWKEALADFKNVCFEVFPSLNHLFMTGEGMGSPAEYEKAGHVDVAVIQTIDDWIESGCIK